MRETSELRVWYKHNLVGQLYVNKAGILGFSYDTDWLDQGFAISLQMPLAKTDYPPEEGIAQQVFGNLLPEGEARHEIVKKYKISNDDSSLLLVNCQSNYKIM